MTDFAVPRDAAETGAIYREHLGLVRTTVHKRPRLSRVATRPAVVRRPITTLDFTDYKNCCRYWMPANDPDGAEPADQTATCSFPAPASR